MCAFNALKRVFLSVLSAWVLGGLIVQIKIIGFSATMSLGFIESNRAQNSLQNDVL